MDATSVPDRPKEEVGEVVEGQHNAFEGCLSTLGHQICIGIVLWFANYFQVIVKVMRYFHHFLSGKVAERDRPN